MYTEFHKELLKLSSQERDEFLGRKTSVLEDVSVGNTHRNSDQFEDNFEEIDSDELKQIIEFMVEEGASLCD